LIHLTPQAQRELGGDEALVFDWHRVAICCAPAGEVSLRRARRTTVDERVYRLLPADGDAPVFAHRMALPHLAARNVTVDCRRTMGVRRFRSNLPPDFGLRAVFGRADEPRPQGGTS
jgi:hypothetical protein